jgi:hypothetical protein
MNSENGGDDDESTFGPGIDIAARSLQSRGGEESIGNDEPMNRLLTRAGIAAAAGVIFNAILRTVVRQAAHVPAGFDPFTWAPIIVATLAGVAGGVIVFLVLRAFLHDRAARAFTWVASVVLVLSLITPITLLWSHPPQYPGTSLVTVLTLEVMHVSTAVATIVALTL